MNQSTKENTPNRIRNTIIALVAVALSVTIFLGIQSENNPTSLEAQAQTSMSLESSLSNGKPTLVEFYANWCTSCQAMAGDLAKVKEKYKNSLNFVMLNVDNTKWLPEILRYEVDGIPHFVFMNSQGETIAQTIGEQPLSALVANLDALVAAQPLPHHFDRGQVSSFTPPVNKPQADDPLTHSTQSQS